VSELSAHAPGSCQHRLLPERDCFDSTSGCRAMRRPSGMMHCEDIVGIGAFDRMCFASASTELQPVLHSQFPDHVITQLLAASSFRKWCLVANDIDVKPASVKATNLLRLPPAAAEQVRFALPSSNVATRTKALESDCFAAHAQAKIPQQCRPECDTMKRCVLHRGDAANRDADSRYANKCDASPHSTGMRSMRSPLVKTTISPFRSTVCLLAFALWYQASYPVCMLLFEAAP